MRFRLVFFMCGMMAMLFGGLMMFPAFVDLYYQNNLSAYTFFKAAFFTLFVGAAIVFITRQEITDKLSPQETFLITSSVWLCAALVSAFPLYLSAGCSSFTDAFFEAMSGLTTTGATTYTHLDSLPKGVLLWRAITHWIGGIGIVVLAISILPTLRVGGMQLFANENSDKYEKDSPFLATKIKAILILYLVLSLLCASLLYSAGMSLFDAIAHMMACVSTGGFSTHDTSIAYFNNKTIDWILILFMLLSSLPFMFTVAFFTGKWERIKNDTQVKSYLAMLLLFILPSSFIIWHAGYFPSFEEALRQMTFSIISIVTTTGFVLDDYQQWGPFFIAFFFFLLGVGGCTGSTSGGIKMFRFNIVFKSLRRHLKMMILPHAVIVPQYNNKPITEEIINSVMVFLSVYILTIVIGTLIVAASGTDLITALSGTFSAISNVGPGIGNVIGPDKTFAAIPPIGKWTLSIVMMLGRLEFMTVTVLLLPTLWKRK